MGLLDKIKAKKTDKPSEEKNVLDMVPDEAQKPKPEAVKAKEDTGRAHRVLERYHLSEKSNIVSQQGRYVFKISNRANKIEVKKAVESVYDVHVTSVNIVNLPGKNRRYGRKTGRTSEWKKAYVTLKPGEKISGLAEGI